MYIYIYTFFPRTLLNMKRINEGRMKILSIFGRVILLFSFSPLFFSRSRWEFLFFFSLSLCCSVCSGDNLKKKKNRRGLLLLVKDTWRHGTLYLLLLLLLFALSFFFSFHVLLFVCSLFFFCCFFFSFSFRWNSVFYNYHLLLFCFFNIYITFMSCFH